MGTKYKGNKKDIKVLDTYIKFSRAFLSLQNALSRNLNNNKLTMSQFGVLEVLYHLGPLNQKVIAEKLLSSSSNLVTVIDNLENNGLVKRERSAEDRRNFIVNLTDKGEKIIEEIFPKHLNIISQTFNKFTEREIDTLGKLSKKLGFNVEK